MNLQQSKITQYFLKNKPVHHQTSDPTIQITNSLPYPPFKSTLLEEQSSQIAEKMRRQMLLRKFGKNIIKETIEEISNSNLSAKSKKMSDSNSNRKDEIERQIQILVKKKTEGVEDDRIVQVDEELQNSRGEMNSIFAYEMQENNFHTQTQEEKGQDRDKHHHIKTRRRRKTDKSVDVSKSTIITNTQVEKKLPFELRKAKKKSKLQHKIARNTQPSFVKPPKPQTFQTQIVKGITQNSQVIYKNGKHMFSFMHEGQKIWIQSEQIAKLNPKWLIQYYLQYV